jgi:hypothetical protein
MYKKKSKNDNYHTGFNKTALYVWGRSVVKYLGALSEAKVKVIVQVFVV